MALTSTQAAQQALNSAASLDQAVRNGAPLSDKVFRQQVTQTLMLLAEAVLGGGPGSSTLDPGIANLSNVSPSANVAHAQR